MSPNDKFGWLSETLEKDDDNAKDVNQDAFWQTMEQEDVVEPRRQQNLNRSTR